MEVVALIISGIALLIAVIAFHRTGGIEDFRGRARSVSSSRMLKNSPFTLRQAQGERGRC